MGGGLALTPPTTTNVGFYLADEITVIGNEMGA